MLPPSRAVHYRAMVAWNALPNFLISECNMKGLHIKLKLDLFTQGLV